MSREPEPHSETTLDPFLGGRLHFFQPKRGYRFSVDAPLLAGFATVRPDDLAADLGAGCGVVGILLAQFYPFRRLVAVEVQEELAGLARRNVDRNGFCERIEVRHQDVNAFAAAETPGRYDLLVCNPPFQPVGATRPSTHRQRAVARQEILLQPDDLFAAARRLLCPGGRMAMIHRPWRWPELRGLMERHTLNPTRVRQVLPGEDEAPNIILVEAVKDGIAELSEQAPLVLFQKSGLYSEEAEALLKGGHPLVR